MLHLKVVIKAVVDRRPEGQLHAVEQPHHRPGHDVGTRMPQQVQGFGSLVVISRSEIWPSAGRGASVPTRLAIDFGGQRGLGQARPDFGGNVDRPDAPRILQGLTVGEDDFEHDF